MEKGLKIDKNVGKSSALRKQIHSLVGKRKTIILLPNYTLNYMLNTPVNSEISRVDQSLQRSSYYKAKNSVVHL